MIMDLALTTEDMNSQDTVTQGMDIQDTVIADTVVVLDVDFCHGYFCSHSSSFKIYGLENS
jgi:hypothetical protein